MTQRPLRFLAAAVAVLTLAGCAYSSSYNPAYLAAARRPAAVQADGKVLIVTTPQDDGYVFSGSPTSFTGGGTKLTLPVGSIVRESAVAAFADTFRGGVEVAADVRDATRYVVIVAPRLVAYSYEYNQIKNVGFAITPTAVVSVDVRLLDDKGATRWQRNYASGPVEGTAYMLNTSPQEEISKVTHKALYDVFARAAGEVREVLAKPAGAAAG